MEATGPGRGVTPGLSEYSRFNCTAKLRGLSRPESTTSTERVQFDPPDDSPERLDDPIGRGSCRRPADASSQQGWEGCGGCKGQKSHN